MWTPFLRFIFGWKIYDVNNQKPVNRFSGFIKFLSSERNTEIICHIYILMKKIIILGKTNMTIKSSNPHSSFFHWKKLNIFTLKLQIY